MIKRTLFSLVVSVVSVVAVLAVQPTSFVTFYQPKVPKALQK